MTTLTVRFHPVGVPLRKARSGMTALALRASAANGFGDGVVAAPALAAAAPAAAAPGLWQRLRQRLDAWLERRRQAAAQRRELRLFAQLDATTLRDLGIEPGELPSLAAELHGTAAATRRWTERALAERNSARLRINSVDSYL